MRGETAFVAWGSGSPFIQNSRNGLQHALVSIPLCVSGTRTTLIHLKRITPYAKKKDGSKRSKKKPSNTSKKGESGKRVDSNKPIEAISNQSIQSNQSNQSNQSTEELAFPGPIAPELLEVDGPIAPSEDSSPSAIVSADDDDEDASTLPVSNEALLKLPDLSSTTSGVRRKRKPRSSAKSTIGRQLGSGEEPSVEEVAAAASELSFDEVRDLTAAYQLGDEGRQKLIDQIEKEPDFVMKTKKKEYDLTSAIFGRGQPNKQGVYVLPYLQSAHLVLTGVAVLAAFVYYPGFPLTESSDEVRETIKKAIGITYAFNAFLGVFAYRSAERRGQPKLFWALKTLALGELAFGELRRNTNLVKDEVSALRRKEKRKERK